jgi:hypothetical protein
MTKIEQVVREVSDLRDFFLRMEPVRRQIQLDEARQSLLKEFPRKKSPIPDAAAKRKRA